MYARSYAPLVEVRDDSLGSWLSDGLAKIGISKDVQRGVTTAAAGTIGTIALGPVGGAIAAKLAAGRPTSVPQASTMVNAAVMPTTAYPTLTVTNQEPRGPFGLTSTQLAIGAGALGIGAALYFGLGRRRRRNPPRRRRSRRRR